LRASHTKFGLEGGFWNFINQASEDFGLIGYLIVGVFIAGRLISVLVYRMGRFDEIGVELSHGGGPEDIGAIVGASSRLQG
jgi:nickel/cobalt transporter (NiCoT) family protein